MLHVLDRLGSPNRAVDIKREKPKSYRRYWLGGAAVLAIAAVTMALGRLEPAAPSVERGTLWIDTVRHGEMVRQVRGPGSLVPEQIRWISAITAGRVEQLPLRAGVPVTKEQLLLTLSNPDVQLQALEAHRQLTAAQAQLVSLRTTLETQRLNQQAVVATTRSDYQDALRVDTVAESLDKRGLLSTNEVGKARDKAAELSERMRIEHDRLNVISSSIKQQIDLQQAQVERLQAIAAFHDEQVRSLQVRAGSDGVLQELPLELGQWVTPGYILAKVAQPGRLKAVLRIPETQAKDVQIGQPSSIDTRNGLVAGHVMRLEPAAQNGTVTVEVALDGALPKGARPDLSVDGTVEIERLTGVNYVGRPAYGQPESTVGMFRLSPNGQEATRVNVKLGRASVNTIEIQQGLSPGDRVIISDMSNWDSHPRIRLR